MLHPIVEWFAGVALFLHGTNLRTLAVVGCL